MHLEVCFLMQAACFLSDRQCSVYPALLVTTLFSNILSVTSQKVWFYLNLEELLWSGS